MPPPMTRAVRGGHGGSSPRCGLAVELGPQRAPAGLRVGDLRDEALDERDLGVQQGEPVLLLDEEQRVHAAGERARRSARGSRRAAPRAGAGGARAASTTSSGGSAAMSDERRDEVRVLVPGTSTSSRSQSRSSAPAGVGERVHRALGALALAGGLLLARRSPALASWLDDHVERAVVELDAALVAVLAQRAAQLVRVHRPAREVGQHREREQVVDLASLRCGARAGHLVSSDYTGPNKSAVSSFAAASCARRSPRPGRDLRPAQPRTAASASNTAGGPATRRLPDSSASPAR